VRLFAALELPDEVRSALRARLADAQALAPDLRWVPIGQWHVTLAFYGEVDQRRVPELVERLGRAARRTRPFAVEVGEPGRFGSARRARVIWWGLGEGAEATRQLAASARAAGRRAGLTRDDLAADARYRPHVTLARVVPPHPVDDVLAALHGEVRPRWHAEQALLVRSELGAGPAGRARHSVHARLPFAALDRN
jgi:2'-5' RNA ligase